MFSHLEMYSIVFLQLVCLWIMYHRMKSVACLGATHNVRLGDYRLICMNEKQQRSTRGQRHLGKAAPAEAISHPRPGSAVRDPWDTGVTEQTQRGSCLTHAKHCSLSWLIYAFHSSFICVPGHRGPSASDRRACTTASRPWASTGSIRGHGNWARRSGSRALQRPRIWARYWRDQRGLSQVLGWEAATGEAVGLGQGPICVTGRPGHPGLVTSFMECLRTVTEGYTLYRCAFYVCEHISGV